MYSEIKNINGLPTLFADGKPVPEMAYITYIPENNRYADFASAGVRLYSVNLNFSEMPINENAPVLVFQKGIFEKDEPDFSIVHKNFDSILSACPDAYIFPRVNVNLSRAWEKSHPDELCENGVSGRCRASFASDLWAEEVKKCLVRLTEYIENSPYADRVIGYQLAGGNTDEWFPFENCGFYGKRAKEKFIRYCEDNRADRNEENYYKFASETVADRIIDFAQTVKNVTDGKKIVGAFYGYTIGCPNRKQCHLALGRLLESDAVDFLCSPLTYMHGRHAGLDTYPMLPVGSVRCRSKLYFSENDIRTHLSRPISPHPNYSVKIWTGPKKSVSLEQIKINFCRALIYGNGMWWFDMWGGWYDDPDFMSLFKRMSEICADGMDCPESEVAVFMDENCYFGLPSHGNIAWNTCNALGLTGVMNDVFLASDFDKVYNDYKVCIFTEPTKTQLMTECICRAKASGKAVRVITESDARLTADDLKGFLMQSGIDVPTPQNAVVYKGKRFVAFHSHEKGVYDLTVDDRKTFTDIFTGEEITFPITTQKTVTYLFSR
ncbi:MAG: hypothetical protein IKJ69_02580 [Clostridia bacterium]|nr:hypothetical protein [Clostridia bacterium]